jgi:hypothetical protein
LGGSLYTQWKKRNWQKYISPNSYFCDCSIDFPFKAL